MSFVFNEFCPLQSKIISEAECIEITAELDDMKTEEHLVSLRRTLGKSKIEMYEICSRCQNYENAF